MESSYMMPTMYKLGAYADFQEGMQNGIILREFIYRSLNSTCTLCLNGYA